MTVKLRRWIGDAVSMADCVDCWAVPGAESLIDVIHPVTGRTWCYQKSAVDVLAESPGAVRMSVADWCESKAARQQAPITWAPSTSEQYHAMLNVLPPALMLGGAFLVGEPWDHCAATGAPRFAAYRRIGCGCYEVASRAMTRAELRAEVERG